MPNDIVDDDRRRPVGLVAAGIAGVGTEGAAATRGTGAPDAAVMGGMPPTPSRAPTGLLTDLLPEPLGIVSGHPRLSWIVPTLGPSTTQAAYQVQIGKTLACVSSGRGLSWDSGRVVSGLSASVVLGGAPLQADALYYWRVRVTDQHGVESDWSAPQRVVTEAGRSWTGRPIWLRDDGAWMLARTTFTASGEVESAWIRATGQSPESAGQYVYRLSLNGEFVGVGPVRSPDPDCETRYHSYDVTSLVRTGRNALTALCYSGSDRAFLAELVIVYRNGRRQVVGTDDAWRVRPAGPWRPLSAFIGGIYYQAPQEDMDARAEPVGWTDPAFDDRGWERPAIRPALPALKPAGTENLAIAAMAPAQVIKLGPGHVVFDMGREIVGGLRLDVTGLAGLTIEVRLGEERAANGGARFDMRSTQTYDVSSNGRDWGYREIWTLRDGPQRFEHWGYRGFRWAELIADPVIDVTAGLQALVLRPAWRDGDAAFRSSNHDLDRVWEMCRYTIAALRSDLYTDTPTRERGPYEGDAIVNQLSEYNTQRSYALARYSTFYLVRRPTWPTEYRLLTPMLAWRDYMATGDASALAQSYDLFVERQLVGFLNADGLVQKPQGESSHTNGDLVDWPKANRDDYDFTDVNTVVNAWQFASFEALSRIAGVIGRPADQARFAGLARRLRDGVNAHLLRADGAYADGGGSSHLSQHATVFPLAFGLTPPASYRAAARLLASQGMRVSVYGAQFLLDALYRAEAGEEALKLLTSKTEYSWLHMMDDLGATVVMEAWDPSIKPNTTFSHAWGSAPVNVAQRWIAGVEVIEPGAAKVRIAPQPGGLDWFEATVPTIRGPVRVAYRRGGSTLLDVTLPPNVEAMIECGPDCLAGADPRRVTVKTPGDGSVPAASLDRLVIDRVQPGQTLISRQA